MRFTGEMELQTVSRPDLKFPTTLLSITVANRASAARSALHSGVADGMALQKRWCVRTDTHVEADRTKAGPENGVGWAFREVARDTPARPRPRRKDLGPERETRNGGIRLTDGEGSAQWPPPVRIQPTPKKTKRTDGHGVTIRPQTEADEVPLRAAGSSEGQAAPAAGPGADTRRCP